MMNSADAIHHAYSDFVLQRHLEFARIGCGLALLLVPAGSMMDFILYEEHFYDFLIARLLCDVAIAVAYFMYGTRNGVVYARYITLSWAFAIQVMLTWMVFSTDGGNSTYYAALNLVILAVGIVLPLSFQEAVLFCISTISIYCMAVWFNSEPLVIPTFINNIYFLTLTGIISSTAVYYNSKRRYYEFKFSYELGAKNEALVKQSEARNDFFSNVSHELRTPLTLLLAPVNDLLRTRANIPQRVTTKLELMRNNGLRLLKLVNDLLEVIKLEEGKARLARHSLDANRLLMGVVDSMAALAESRGLTIEREYYKFPLLVMADERALEKVFINLINNAVKFTPKGGRIRVRSGVQGSQLSVEISDTGIGIDADQLPHIFERFRQVDSSSTRSFQGTGLGLALVKELIEKMEGSIGVESTRGEGTRFSVTLPLDELGVDEETVVCDDPPIDDDDPLSTIYFEADRHVSSALSGLDEPVRVSMDADDTRPLVLVADDEPDMRDYLSEMLSEDYRVLAAADGAVALDLALAHHPDLLLLDLMMPGLDGLEVCRRLKADEEGRRSRIIMLTASPVEEKKVQALELGADDFLSKPFSSVEVRTRLRNLYDNAALERELLERNRALEAALEELQLLHEQLIRNEKMKALGTLTAGLLHEINNPLNNGLSTQQLALRQPEVGANEKLRRQLERIGEQMWRISDILKALHVFAYPGDVGPDSRFDLTEAVRQALTVTQHQHKGLVVAAQTPEHCWVRGSASQLMQVLVNLIGNAAQAVRDAGRGADGEIRIVCDVEAERVWLRVLDNGKGVDEVLRTHIFDPFFTTRKQGEGLGLGLSICHTIVNNHGGNLSVSATENGWTEFKFDLPLFREEDGSAAKQAPESMS